MAVKPNKENIITDMLTELANGITYSECLVDIGSKWQLPEQTFVRYWNEANKRHLETQQEAQKQMNDETIKAMVDAVKSGLKSKIERTLEKQKDIQLLRDSVESGLTDDYYIADGQYITYQRPLTMVEKATILKRASEIESEISKIEADYAPTKIAPTDKDGNNLKPMPQVIINGAKPNKN